MGFKPAEGFPQPKARDGLLALEEDLTGSRRHVGVTPGTMELGVREALGSDASPMHKNSRFRQLVHQFEKWVERGLVRSGVKDSQGWYRRPRRVPLPASSPGEGASSPAWCWVLGLQVQGLDPVRAAEGEGARPGRLLVTTQQMPGPGVSEYGLGEADPSAPLAQPLPLPPWLRWVAVDEMRAGAVAAGLPHLVTHLDALVAFLMSKEAQPWPHPACHGDQPLMVPQRRRDATLNFSARNDNNAPGKHPADWDYQLPVALPADLGRLFAPHVIVDSLKNDVLTWDWSGLLPVLENSANLRGRMRTCTAALDPKACTDGGVVEMLVAARKNRNLVKHDDHVPNHLRAEVVERYLTIALLCEASEDHRCVRKLPVLRDRNRADRQVHKEEVQVLRSAHTHSAKWFQVLHKCGSGTFGCVFKVTRSRPLLCLCLMTTHTYVPALHFVGIHGTPHWQVLCIAPDHPLPKAPYALKMAFNSDGCSTDATLSRGKVPAGMCWEGVGWGGVGWGGGWDGSAEWWDSKLH